VRVLNVNQPAAIPLPVPTMATGCGCSAGAEGLGPLLGLILLALHARRRRS